MTSLGRFPIVQENFKFALSTLPFVLGQFKSCLLVFKLYFQTIFWKSTSILQQPIIIMLSFIIAQVQACRWKGIKPVDEPVS